MHFPIGKNAFFVVNITETCYIKKNISSYKGAKFMIHRPNEYKSEVREAMRGGDKSVKITHYFDEANELMNKLTRIVLNLKGD